MTYFKDISNILAEKYPNRNVYVISDQHFDHKNIIGLMKLHILMELMDGLNQIIQQVLMQLVV